MSTENKGFWQRHKEASNAARIAYQQSMLQEETAKDESARLLYERDPIAYTEKTKRDWIKGEAILGSLTLASTSGTVFLSESTPGVQVGGLITLSVIAALGTFYSEYGRWRTSRYLKSLQRTTPSKK